MNPNVWLALLAGVFSFLSPCVLPLVPSYLSVVTGSSGTAAGEMGSGATTQTGSRAATMRNALGFIAGFGLVFLILGASLGLLGQLLQTYRLEVSRFSGALIALFGLQMLGLLRLPWLGTGWAGLRLERFGLAGPVALGAAFGTGWTPCIGPVLGSILTLAASSGDTGRGVLLLTAYTVGLGLPFIATAFAAQPVLAWAKRHRRAHLWFERIAGLVLLVMGVLVATNQFARLNAVLIGFTPQWLLERL